jgi:hypothetical protein
LLRKPFGLCPNPPKGRALWTPTQLLLATLATCTTAPAPPATAPNSQRFAFVRHVGVMCHRSVLPYFLFASRTLLAKPHYQLPPARKIVHRSRLVWRKRLSNHVRLRLTGKPSDDQISFMNFWMLQTSLRASLSFGQCVMRLQHHRHSAC